MALKIVGIGELLWDVFPDGKYPGGAPFNFAWHALMLGAEAGVISRAGQDDLGRELLEVIKAAGFDTRLIQQDDRHPTGTVKVTLAHGQPSYTITENVAWDFIEATAAAGAAVREADVVCFGSLARRSARSSETIAALIAEAGQAKIIFDVNLRQKFYTREILENSLRAANVAKLNGEELCIIGKMLAPGESPAEGLLRRYELDLVVETLGAEGCAMHSASGCLRRPAFKVEVADAVGAGDAFTAALAIGLARGDDLAAIARQANAVGAFVASRRGATPRYSPQELAAFIERTENQKDRLRCEPAKRKGK
jgi:fructokinase